MKRIVCLLLVILSVLSCAQAETLPSQNGFKQSQYTIFVGKTLRPGKIAKGVKGKITYTYQSSDESIATVSKGGTVKGIAPGTAVISGTAQVKGETVFTLQTTIVVIQPVKRITTPTKKITMAPDTQWKIETQITPEDATNQQLTWKSSKPSVATVSEDGTITALKRGSCKITGRATDGSKKAVTIQVRVSKFDVVITSAGGADVTFDPKTTAEFTATYKVRNALVELTETANQSFHLNPLKAGSDTVTVTVKPTGRRARTIKYSVYVSPSALMAEEEPVEEPAEEPDSQETAEDAENREEAPEDTPEDTPEDAPETSETAEPTGEDVPDELV